MKFDIDTCSEETFFVAPLVGAWIEMQRVLPGGGLNIVAPLVGAWIEILEFLNVRMGIMSLLL